MRKSGGKMALWTLVFALALAGGTHAQERTIRTGWDLSELYESEEAWMEDYGRYEELLEEYGSYAGKLSSSDGVYDWLCFDFLGEKPRLYSKLYIFTKLGASLNPGDPLYDRLRARLDQLDTKEKAALAQGEREIFALPLSKRQEIFGEERFSLFDPYIGDYVSESYKPLSEDAKTIYRYLPLEEGKWEDIYALLLSEQPWDSIWMPDGQWEEMNGQLYWEILGGGYEDDFVAEAFETYMGSFGAFQGTYAALLEGAMSEYAAHAKIEGYDSAREAALAGQEVPEAFYENLLKAVHEGIPEYQRYLALHGEALWSPVQYSFQRFAQVSGYDPGYISLEEGILKAAQALSVLGEDYEEDYWRIWEAGHVDVYPDEEKLDGSFEIAVNKEILPYVMLNYYGETEDLLTLCHEMGHAIYDLRSEEAQPDLYEEPSSFTQEVAALTNEILMGLSLLEEAETKEERLYYLESLLYTLGSSYFEQMCYAEFEDACYQMVEAGEGLPGEEVCSLFLEKLAEYEGEEVAPTPGREYFWVQIEHLYMNYYLYQYAAAVTCACRIAEDIWQGKEGALPAYQRFLTLGCSEAPEELLMEAGVDIRKEETCRAVVDLFASLTDEYEELLGELGYLEEEVAS